MKIYLYDEKTKELDEVIEPKDYNSLKTILYNISDKNSGYLVYPRPLNMNENISCLKKKSNDFKFHCQHIYENNGNFLKLYGIV